MAQKIGRLQKSAGIDNMNKEQLEELQRIVDKMEEDLKNAIFYLNETRIGRHAILELMRQKDEDKF